MRYLPLEGANRADRGAMRRTAEASMVNSIVVQLYSEFSNPIA
jgi:hypothetical protein